MQRREQKKVRHVLGLSGGKDSSALAIYLRERVPEMEYVFCDTGKELPETYEFLTKMEAYLGKPIQRLVSERDFDHYLDVFNGYLPSSRMRWCTRLLKLKPFEQYVGSDPVINYVGIRADEQREGYISTKPNITSVFPFRDDGIAKADVLRILEESGVGIPEYYRWRSRSGCFFCFFQRKEEWVGLKREHPEFFDEAKGLREDRPRERGAVHVAAGREPRRADREGRGAGRDGGEARTSGEAEEPAAGECLRGARRRAG
jgi:3'-phosphoadenosine 5'-phosphosulfate sulfotransferase (PAPS reductase)/FAD synthetase